MTKKNTLTAAKKAKGDEAARSGRLIDAQALLASVCRMDPVDVEALVKLSLVEKRIGNYLEAERCARKAVTISPSQGFAHHALGVALHSQGKLSDAIGAYRTAVKLLPGFADANYLMGCALYESGEPQAALQSLSEAVRLQPNFADALGNIGAVLLDIGKAEEAVDYLERALAVQPNNAVARGNLANALRLQGKNDEALACFRLAHTLAPDSAEVIAGFVDLLEKGNRLKEAHTILSLGQQTDPEHPRLLLVAAQLARREKRFEDAASILEKLLQKNVPLQLAADAELTLGHVFDHLGDAARAFPLFVSGKAKKAKCAHIGADERVALSRLAIHYSEFATPALAESQSSSSKDPGMNALVFLIGFPRSGTTLLEQFLDSHPGVQSMEEKGAVAAMVAAYLDRFGDNPDTLTKLGEVEAEWMRSIYYGEVDRHIDRTSGTLFVDKLPLNIISIPFIWKAFPDAKYILAVRHPCDVVLSCLMQNFASNEGMSSFFALEDSVQAYVDVMSGWECCSKVLPLVHHRVRYEDLVDDAEGQCRELLVFLGIPWDERILDHASRTSSQKAINTPSYHQVALPIYKESRYRWERYRQEFAPVIDALRPFITHFGYLENE